MDGFCEFHYEEFWKSKDDSEKCLANATITVMVTPRSNTQLKKLFQEELSSGRIPPSVFRGYHLTVFICLTKTLITRVFVGFDKQ